LLSFRLCARGPVEFPRLRDAYLFERLGVADNPSPGGLLLRLSQRLSVDEWGRWLLPAFPILPHDLLGSLLGQQTHTRRPFRFRPEFVDEVSMSCAMLPQSLRMISEVEREDLLPDVTAILRAFGSTLAGGPGATSVRPPLDVECGNAAIRFQALVTNPKTEGLAIIARRLVVESRAFVLRFGDDRIAKCDPVIHQFAGAGFFDLLPQAIDRFKAAIQLFAAPAGVVLEVFVTLSL
jgi:hypothetical protein